MNKRFSWTVLLAILLVILSLAGCGSTSVSKQEPKKETKTVEVTAKADNKAEQKSKEQTSIDVAKTVVVASVEKKAPQPAAEKTESGKIAQPAQKSVPAAKPVTPTTTSKNTAASTGKTTGRTTTNTTTKTSTNTTKTSTNTNTTKTATTTTPAVKPVAAVPKPVNTVILSIVGPKPANLSATKIKINEGYTIFDVLKHANEDKIISMDASGSGSTAYIQGINNVYEFDNGPKSGWVFKLNGVSITKSVGVIKVKAGDHIEGYYTK